eukprot:TRINITY_DN34687_c0_g1_i1.p3 TRINITY_DN34687_c0_g1~~TRINITY_DN34687_c0_g1_i1.p3  ORF type:complete len:135 (+),score=10.61 TRINITY_DN34687_c0_g1_i1:43-405(+)
MAFVLRNVRSQVGRHLKFVDHSATFAGQRRFAATGEVKYNAWEKPLAPSEWKEEHLVILCLTGFYFLVRYMINFVSSNIEMKEKQQYELTLATMEKEEAELEAKYGHGLPISSYYKPSAA